MIRALVISVMLLALSFASRSQEGSKGSVEGRVESAEDSAPLPGANIVLQGTVLGTTTNATGHFILHTIPDGRYSLSVSMVGFRRKVIPLAMGGGRTVTGLVIDLEPAAVQTAPVTVTASRREQSLEEAPASVSVVEEKDLAFRNSVTIDDALRYVPGVNITRGQVNVRGSTGFSYGVGSRVLLLLDGMPFLTGDTGEIIWESLPSAAVDRLEVVKGAGSALYGSSALGGVINVITKRPTEQPETSIRLQGGTVAPPGYQQWRWTDDSRSSGGVFLSHQQRIGSLSVLAGGSRTVDDGYKRNDYWKRWNMWARAGYDFSPFQSAAISFNLLDQQRGNFFYWKDFNHPLEPKDDQLTQWVRSQRWNLGGTYRQIVSAEGSFTAKANWFHTRWNDNVPNSIDSAGSRSVSDAASAEVQVNYQLAADDILTGGLFGSYDRVNAETIFGRRTGKGLAIYLQDELGLPWNLSLTTGGRFDFQKLESLSADDQFNPKAALVMTPEAGSSLRLSIGRGFRAPSIAEVYTTTEAGGITIRPNPDLLPERSWSFELGGSRAFSDNLSADLSLFRSELWDLIEPSFGSDGSVHFENVTRARVTGTEITINADFMHHLLGGRVSYTYAYPQDATSGEILKYRPRHLLLVSATSDVQPVRAGVDFRYMSRMERIDEEFVNLGIVPDGDRRVAIYLTDVHLSVDWSFAGLPLRSTASINNLFQYYYTDFIGNLGPLRTYLLTLEAVVR